MQNRQCLIQQLNSTVLYKCKVKNSIFEKHIKERKKTARRKAETSLK